MVDNSTNIGKTNNQFSPLLTCLSRHIYWFNIHPDWYFFLLLQTCLLVESSSQLSIYFLVVFIGWIFIPIIYLFFKVMFIGWIFILIFYWFLQTCLLVESSSWLFISDVFCSMSDDSNSNSTSSLWTKSKSVTVTLLLVYGPKVSPMLYIYIYIYY